MDKKPVMIIVKSLHYNYTITTLEFPSKETNDLEREIIEINIRRNQYNMQQLVTRFIAH